MLDSAAEQQGLLNSRQASESSDGSVQEVKDNLSVGGSDSVSVLLEGQGSGDKGLPTCLLWPVGATLWRWWFILDVVISVIAYPLYRASNTPSKNPRVYPAEPSALEVAGWLTGLPVLLWGLAVLVFGCASIFSSHCMDEQRVDELLFLRKKRHETSSAIYLFFFSKLSLIVMLEYSSLVFADYQAAQHGWQAKNNFCVAAVVALLSVFFGHMGRYLVDGIVGCFLPEVNCADDLQKRHFISTQALDGLYTFFLYAGIRRFSTWGSVIGLGVMTVVGQTLLNLGRKALWNFYENRQEITILENERCGDAGRLIGVLLASGAKVGLMCHLNITWQEALDNSVLVAAGVAFLCSFVFTLASSAWHYGLGSCVTCCGSRH